MPPPAQAQLRALSASLRELTALVRRSPPQALLEAALQLLAGLVPFDSAWWGEVSAGTAEVAPRNWLHGSIGLSKSFADEWNQLSSGDDFALQSIAALGQVIRQSDAIDPLLQPEDVAAFSQRHGLFHCMAITAPLGSSGLMFFVSLYRSKSRAHFSEQEGLLFGEFVAHLLQHWQHTLEDLGATPSHQPWDGYALADADGQLLFVGQRIGLALHVACPRWSGTELPAALHGALRTLPCSWVLGPACRLRLVACGSLVAISLPSGRERSPLSPRELGAALLYANGHSNKEIALTLGLTPATVRTYLRSSYALLGVRNKVELASALRKT